MQMVYHSCRNPDTANIRDKMTYSYDKALVTEEFDGIWVEFQLNNIGDADYDSLAKKFKENLNNTP